MQFRQQHLNNVKTILVIVILILLFILYSKYNPNDNNFFPKCPFLSITGYKCAGCGSQRAIHSLLHFDIKGAIYYNFLLVIFLPYLVIGFLLERLKLNSRFTKICKVFFNSTKSILFILAVIICFWIIRNTSLWPLN